MIEEVVDTHPAIVRRVEQTYRQRQSDRHDGNWMVKNTDGKLALIDNGLAFPNGDFDTFLSNIFAHAVRNVVPKAVKSWDADKINNAMSEHDGADDRRRRGAREGGDSQDRTEGGEPHRTQAG